LSVWGVVISAGAAVGVILGGVITQYLGWRWNFFINVPIGFLAILGILKWVPAHIQEARQPHLDLPGAILVTGGLVALVYALTLASRLGWTESSTLVSLFISLVLLAVFVYNETRVRYPLAPLSIFRLRSVTGGNLIMLLVVGGSIGVGYFTSLYVQNVLRYPPALSGLSFLPIPIIIGLISTRAPRLLSRFGYKLLLVIGIALMALAIFLLSFSTATSGYLTHLLPAFIILAVGDGFAFVAGTVAATTGVRGEESGLASGLVNTSQQVGGALGLAVLAWVAASVTASSLAAGQGQVQATLHGYQLAFLTSTAMLTVALAIAIFVIREPESQDCQDCPDGRSFELD
jgi:MFS family permease